MFLYCLLAIAYCLLENTMFSHRLPKSLLALVCGLMALPSVAQKGSSADDAAKKAIKAFFAPKPQAPSAASSVLLATITDKRIRESSGLAASRRTPDVFWTHNDSGDGPYVFALGRTGRTLARFQVPDAKSVDWEDIAVGPGVDGKPTIYIGDIGDNGRRRDDTVIYRVEEPSLDVRKTMQEATTAPAQRLPFRYPDGHHDCETLMVHPKTGEIFLVTKERNGRSGVYKFPMPLIPYHQVTLEKVGEVRFTSSFLSGRLAEGERMATAGDIAPDGSSLVIRTYLMGYEWKLAPGQSVADALKVRPRSFLLPLTRQGEALCYRADSKALLVTSEGENPPLYEIKR